MDYNAVRMYVDVGIFIVNAAVGIYVWLSNRNRVTHQRITDLEKAQGDRMTALGDRISSVKSGFDKTLARHGERLAKIETDIEHVPSSQEITELRNLVSGVAGDVKGLTAAMSGINEQIKPIQHTLSLVNQYLLDHK